MILTAQVYGSTGTPNFDTRFYHLTLATFSVLCFDEMLNKFLAEWDRTEIFYF